MPLPVLLSRASRGGIPTSGLYLWLKADAGTFSDAGTTPAVNAGTVQQWNDQSGNSRHAIQLTGSKKPTLTVVGQNGKPNVVFDVDDFLAVTTSNLASPYTLIIVGRCTNANGYMFDGTPFDQGGISYSGGNLRLIASGGTVSMADTPGATKIITAINNSTSSSLRVNNGTATTGTSGGSLVSPFQIGGISIGLGIQGWINELLLFNYALAAATQESILRTLNAKWAVY